MRYKNNPFNLCSSNLPFRLATATGAFLSDHMCCTNNEITYSTRSQLPKKCSLFPFIKTAIDCCCYSTKHKRKHVFARTSHCLRSETFFGPVEIRIYRPSFVAENNPGKTTFYFSPPSPTLGPTYGAKINWVYLINAAGRKLCVSLPKINKGPD